MSTKKYRLIREYPGSPKIGDIINTSKNFKGESLYYNREVCFKPSDYPEFWEEVKATTTIVSVRRESDKKVFSVGDIVLIEDFIHRIKSIYIDSFESVWLEVYLIDSPNIVSHVLLDSI